MHTEKKPDTRLLSALPYLTDGGVVADIGTDHAYLPIELIRRGLARRAIACDINEGPIETARRHIAEAGLSHVIDTLRTDGLCGVETYRPTDVLIFGMGGELIARILADAPWVREEKTNLILQPMSKGEVLCRWLLENGFAVLHESLTYEGQYYRTIHARAGEKCERYTEAELYLGKYGNLKGSPLLEGYLQRKQAVLERAAEGKRKGGQPTDYEEGILAELRENWRR